MTKICTKCNKEPSAKKRAICRKCQNKSRTLKYKNDPVFKDKMIKYHKNLYDTDPVYKEKVLATNKEYMKTYSKTERFGISVIKSRLKKLSIEGLDEVLKLAKDFKKKHKDLSKNKI